MSCIAVAPKLVRSVGMVLRALPLLLPRPEAPEILSLDLFDTLLSRPPAGEAIWIGLWAEEAGKVLSIAADRLVAARRSARRAAIRGSASGFGRPDPEPTHNMLLVETLRLAGLGYDVNPEILLKLEALEIDAITSVTLPDPAAVQLVQRARQAGLKLLITSDMYLSAEALWDLLARHGLGGFSAIYVSSTQGRTKFSGKLFDHLLEQESITPFRVLHVGDHPWSDGIAPASRGIRSRWIGSASMPSVLRRWLISSTLPASPSGCSLGTHTLAPFLFPALSLLQVQLKKLEPDLILYVARDGELLQRLMEAADLQPPAPVHYALLSRRSTLTPSLQSLELSLACELLGFRRHNRGLLTLFNALSIDPEPYLPVIRSAGFTQLEQPIPTPSQDPCLIRLLNDSVFQAEFAKEVARQRHLLRNFLGRLGYFQARRVVLVDIGWRGSIQDSLAAAFAADNNAPELHGIYLGLWDDGLVGERRSFANKVGLLSDLRRGRHPLEAALPELGPALEPIFRARHGTVMGYCQVHGHVEAILDDDPLRRRHEQDGETHFDAIRQGLIEGCRQLATDDGRKSLLPAIDRCVAQVRLMRLAYFPSRQEIGLLGALPISEGSEPQWNMPAIVAFSSKGSGNRFTALRDWAQGLESPWRAGYVASTAGALGATLYFLAQMIWVPLPAAAKRFLRRNLRQFVYFSS